MWKVEKMFVKEGWRVGREGLLIYKLGCTVGLREVNVNSISGVISGTLAPCG
jgi:hypothetical protein